MNTHCTKILPGERREDSPSLTRWYHVEAAVNILQPEVWGSNSVVKCLGAHGDCWFSLHLKKILYHKKHIEEIWRCSIGRVFCQHA